MKNFKICDNSLNLLCYFRKLWSNLDLRVERELLAIIMIVKIFCIEKELQQS